MSVELSRMLQPSVPWQSCFSKVSHSAYFVSIATTSTPDDSLFPNRLLLQYFLMCLPIQNQNYCFINQCIKKIKSLLTGKQCYSKKHRSMYVRGSLWGSNGGTAVLFEVAFKYMEIHLILNEKCFSGEQERRDLAGP